MKHMMKQQNLRTLIIPDVHGRTFWIDALDKFPQEEYPDLDIVFLGDYVDPYTSYEGISKDEALYNFKKLLKVAKEDKRIKLLLGNHDWHYIVHLDTSRMDFDNEEEIKNLYIENQKLFSIAYDISINGKTYLLTHAGVTAGWWESVKGFASNPPKKFVDNEYVKFVASDDFKLNAESLNTTLNFDDLNLYGCVLSMISRERGGYYPWGSCIWADASEHEYSRMYNEYSEDFKKEYNIKELPYQIFGHTWSYPTLSKYYIGENYAVIDCRKAFGLYDDEKQPLKEIV